MAATDVSGLGITQEEIQYIVNVIAQRPMAECEPIINKIRHQIASKESKLEVKK